MRGRKKQKPSIQDYFVPDLTLQRSVTVVDKFNQSERSKKLIFSGKSGENYDQSSSFSKTDSEQIQRLAAPPKMVYNLNNAKALSKKNQVKADQVKKNNNVKPKKPSKWCCNENLKSILQKQQFSHNSKKSRIILIIFFSLVLLPTLSFHTWLKLKLGTQMKLMDVRASDYDFASTSKRMLQKTLDSLGFDSELDSATYDSASSNKTATLEQDMQDKEKYDVINLSLTHVIFSEIMLAIALCFSQQANGLLSNKIAPVLTQLALCGLMPLVGLKMPYYPLQNVNGILFLMASSLNVIFQVKAQSTYVVTLLIQVIFILLMFVYYRQRKPQDNFWEGLNLNDQFDALAVGLNPLFAVHLIVTSLVYFVLIVVVSKSLVMGKKMLNELTKLQFNRFYEFIGVEHRPYVVTMLVDSPTQTQSSYSSAKTKPALEEVGFQVTFISQEFSRLFLDQSTGEQCKIEDLLFSQISVATSGQLSNKIGANFENSKSDDEHLSQKQRYHRKKSSDNLMPFPVHMNLKQIVDQWEAQPHNKQMVYEFKSIQQLRREKVYSLEHKDKIKDRERLDLDLEEQQNLLEPSRAQRDELLIRNPFDQNNKHRDEEARLRLDYQQRIQQQQLRQVSSTTQQGVARSFVKIKIEQHFREDKVYRTLHFKVVQEQELESQTTEQDQSAQDQSQCEEIEQISEDESNNGSDSQSYQSSNRKSVKSSITVKTMKTVKTFRTQKTGKLDAKMTVVRKKDAKTKEKLKVAKSVMHLLEGQSQSIQSVIDSIEAIEFTVKKFSNYQKFQNGQAIADFVQTNNSSLPCHNQMQKLNPNPSIGVLSNSFSPQNLFNNSVARKESSDNSLPLPQLSSVSRIASARQSSTIQTAMVLTEIMGSISQAKSRAGMLQLLVKTSDLLLSQKFKPIRVSGFETQSGGPKQVTKEIVDKMSSVLAEKQTRVKITSHLLEDGSELNFHAQIFQLTMFNALLWSFNFSQDNKNVNVEIAVDNNHGRDSHSMHSSQDFHQQSEGQYSGILPREEIASEQESTDGFLIVYVHFLGINELLSDEIQAYLRKDENYQSCKKFLISIGGRLQYEIVDEIVLIQIILPLDEQMVEAMQSFSHSDYQFWQAKRIALNGYFDSLMQTQRKKVIANRQTLYSRNELESKLSLKDSSIGPITFGTFRGFQRHQISDKKLRTVSSAEDNESRQLSLKNYKSISSNANSKIKRLSVEIQPLGHISDDFMNFECQQQNLISISSKPVKEDQYLHMHSIDESNDDEMHSNGSIKDCKHSDFSDDSEPADSSKRRKVLAQANQQYNQISVGSASLSAASSISYTSNSNADADLCQPGSSKADGLVMIDTKKSKPHSQDLQSMGDDDKENPDEDLQPVNLIDGSLQSKLIKGKLPTIKEEDKSDKQMSNRSSFASESIHQSRNMQFIEEIKEEEGEQEEEEEKQVEEEEKKEEVQVIETDYTCSIDMNSDQMDEAQHNMNDKYFNLANHAKNNQLPSNKQKDEDPQKEDQNPFQSKEIVEKDAPAQPKIEVVGPFKSVESVGQQNELRQKCISLRPGGIENRSLQGQSEVDQESKLLQRVKAKAHKSDKDLVKDLDGSPLRKNKEKPSLEVKSQRLRFVQIGDQSIVMGSSQSIPIDKEESVQQKVSVPDSAINSNSSAQSMGLSNPMSKAETPEQQSKKRRNDHRLLSFSSRGSAYSKKDKRKSSGSLNDDKESGSPANLQPNKNLKLEDQQRAPKIIEEEKVCDCSDSFLIATEREEDSVQVEQTIKNVLKVQVVISSTSSGCLKRYKRDTKKTCCPLQYHFILIDHKVTSKEGVALASSIQNLYLQLKQRSKYIHITAPKIILLADDNKKHQAQEQESGFQVAATLQMPLDKVSLLNSIQQHLSVEQLDRLLI